MLREGWAVNHKRVYRLSRRRAGGAEKAETQPGHRHSASAAAAADASQPGVDDGLAEYSLASRWKFPLNLMDIMAGLGERL